MTALQRDATLRGTLLGSCACRTVGPLGACTMCSPEQKDCGTGPHPNLLPGLFVIRVPFKIEPCIDVDGTTQLPFDRLVFADAIGPLAVLDAAACVHRATADGKLAINEAALTAALATFRRHQGASDAAIFFDLFLVDGTALPLGSAAGRAQVPAGDEASGDGSEVSSLHGKLLAIPVSHAYSAAIAITAGAVTPTSGSAEAPVSASAS